MLIYKYVDYEVASKILDNGLVRMNVPSKFNDPFDSILDEPDNVLNKCVELYENYKISVDIYNMLKSNFSRMKIKDKALVKPYLNAYDSFKKGVIQSKLYVPFPNINEFINVALCFNSKLRNNINTIKREARKALMNILESCRDISLVTCFSLRYDSTLMWSHYADSHKGICIEFETIEGMEPRAINYSNERVHLDLYYILQRIFASGLIDGHAPKAYEKEEKHIIEPYYTKSRDWEYEQEVRFNFTKNESEGHLTKLNDGWYYMNPGLIKTIYIGCKCDATKADQIEHIARDKGISIKHMKPDVDSFNMIVLD